MNQYVMNYLCALSFWFKIVSRWWTSEELRCNAGWEISKPSSSIMSRYLCQPKVINYKKQTNQPTNLITRLSMQQAMYKSGYIPQIRSQPDPVHDNQPDSTIQDKIVEEWKIYMKN